MKPSALARKIAAKARQERLDQLEQRAKAKKQARERKAVAEANMLTPDGFHPGLRAKLIDASKRAHEDPQAKAVVERAALQHRVERLRRDKGIGQVAPPIFMGELADAQGRPIDPLLARARALTAEQIPPSVGEMREAQRQASQGPQTWAPTVDAREIPPMAAPSQKKGKR